MDNKNILKREHLYEQIADTLEQDIIRNRLVGDRLPSEQQLSDSYGVSRTVIREALKLLRERGLIDSKTGSGAYITKPEEQNLSEVIARIIRTSEISYEDVYDVRCVLEKAAARRAAVKATNEELAQMAEYLEKLNDENLPLEERTEYDYQFHYIVAQASRNDLLLMLVGALGIVFKEVIEQSSYPEGSIEDGIKRHGQIMNALLAKDPELAEHMMYDHIYHSKCNYTRNLMLNGQSEQNED